MKYTLHSFNILLKLVHERDKKGDFIVIKYDIWDTNES